jgi:hypothetical protein
MRALFAVTAAWMAVIVTAAAQPFDSVREAGAASVAQDRPRSRGLAERRYMIYSPAFEALPAPAKTAVLARLSEVITDRDTIDILDDTKAGWRR